MFGKNSDAECKTVKGLPMFAKDSEIMLNWSWKRVWAAASYCPVDLLRFVYVVVNLGSIETCTHFSTLHLLPRKFHSW